MTNVEHKTKENEMTSFIINRVATGGIRTVLVNSGKWDTVSDSKFVLKATNQTQLEAVQSGMFNIITKRCTRTVNAMSALRIVNALNSM